ncbi:AMP-binding protein [Kutzneria sp. CA-103260]|uniref:AMP-binding protein n=1 Tax=Kutzneria sp. CA-103260 TaxID=2802641 RepID=UPI001BA76DC7|nr:class I adenylate-forming enzyme family protein [Kutzneria sp. CA-103260]QUQ68819.1 fatty-acyl-CoA synthase [Kutzneria sp. CA-103260]
MTADAPVVFHTSGHTGEPVRWLRTRAQILAEVRVVADAVLVPVDQVVCFAPPQHIFGGLFGRELPALQGIPVVDAWREPTSPPSIPAGLRTLFVCVPSSWPLLRAVAGDIARLPASVALHGSGPSTPTARQVCRSLAGKGFRAAEIFGSTETGGIATRDLVADDVPPWTLLPDVTFARDGADTEQLLAVRSPRLARREDMVATPDQWRTQDVVRLVDDRHFDFIGRTSRLVKINGVRVDIGVVERLVAATFPDVDVACVPVVDETRGEHYELCYAGRDDEPGMIARLMEVIASDGGTPVPRTVRRVPAIARSATGKVLLEQLRTAAD